MDEFKFRRYERVRKTGNYNMVLDADKAMKEAHLLPEDYWFIVRHYKELKEKYHE